MFHKSFALLISIVSVLGAFIFFAPKAQALSDLEQATQDAYYVIENYYNDSPENIADYCVFYAYDFSNSNGSLQNNGIRTLVYKKSDVTMDENPTYSGKFAYFHFGVQSQTYVTLNVAVVFGGTSNMPYYYGTGTNFTRRPSQGRIWNLGIRSDHLVNPFIIHGSLSSSEVYNLPYEHDVMRAQYVQETFAPGSSSVDDPSSLGLFSSMFNSYFIVDQVSVTGSAQNYESFVGKKFPVVLKDVQSDTGYNLISLQVPDLYTVSDCTFYGHYIFEGADIANTYFKDLTLSFVTFPPGYGSEEIEEGINVVDDSFYYVSVDNTQITKPVDFTFNSMSFMYGSDVVSYGSHTGLAFDWRQPEEYPSYYPQRIFFSAVGSINLYSPGSFVYNFTYSSINKVSDDSPLDDDDIAKKEKEGKDKNDKTEDEHPFVPQKVHYPDDRLNFDDPNFNGYDFSPLNSLFNSLFSWYVVDMMLACAGVGLLGYVLFGRGD